MTLSGQNVVGCSYFFVWLVGYFCFPYQKNWYQVMVIVCSGFFLNGVTWEYLSPASPWSSVICLYPHLFLFFNFFYLLCLVIDINLEFCLHRASHRCCLQPWSSSHVKIISQQRDVSPFLPWLLTAFFPLLPWCFSYCFA